MKPEPGTPANRANRSMPEAVIIPELAYPDVRQAVDWLCRTFGFSERLKIGDHRAQLSYGKGAIIVTQQRTQASSAERSHSIMVRVADVNAHYQHAKESGARIISTPKDHPYGERQYTVEDPGGHVWTFSQSIADIDPAIWGGELIEP